MKRGRAGGAVRQKGGSPTERGGGSQGSRRSRTGGAQSDEMMGGEMKSLKRDEEEGRTYLKMKPMRSQLKKFFRSNRSKSSKISERVENR